LRQRVDGLLHRIDKNLLLSLQTLLIASFKISPSLFRRVARLSGWLMTRRRGCRRLNRLLLLLVLLRRLLLQRLLKHLLLLVLLLLLLLLLMLLIWLRVEGGKQIVRFELYRTHEAWRRCVDELRKSWPISAP